MILPLADRPARRVVVRVGDEELTAHPDGRVELPRVFLGAHPRQIADELRSQGVLPPLPEVELPAVEESHAYPCPTCGGIGWLGASLSIGCRVCRTTGEVVEQPRRSYS